MMYFSGNLMQSCLNSFGLKILGEISRAEVQTKETKKNNENFKKIVSVDKYS